MFTLSIPGSPSDFAQLRGLMVARGYFNRQPLYYTRKMIQTGLMVLVVFGLIIFTDWTWIHVLDALFLAFVLGQVAFLTHDAGHHQIFGSAKRDAIIGYISTFLVGGSLKYWVSKHNEHHAHPNHEDMDPDIEIPILAFSPNQALQKKGLQRFIVKRQHWFFFFVLCLSGYSLRQQSVKYCLRQPLRKVWLDLTLIVAHYVVLIAILVTFLPLWVAILFFFLHELTWGLYMGMVFAPNHKGMLIIGKDEKIDFLREQVLTSRNLISHPFTDFVYGGLNYQVEHHLFPNMPSNNLRKANVLVKQFCKEKSIPYHETSILRSYYEILSYMKEVSKVLH